MSSAAESSWPWLVRRFVTTRWSLLRRVARNPEQDQISAAEVCRLYWHPLYAFLRSRGHGETESQDHVQTFLIRLLRGDILAKADANQGRFRCYVTTLLLRHVSSARTRAAAKKRGGGIPDIVIDWTSAESAYLKDMPLAASPEDIFRRALAARLIDDATLSLRKRYIASGREALFEALLPALEGPLVEGTYITLAAELSLQPGALRVAAIRLRARFRECLRAAASQALHLPAGPALDEELREIFS